MRVLKLSKKDEKKLYDVLNKFGEVWAPVPKGSRYVYDKIEKKEDLVSYNEFVRTILPIKKFLMPQDFNILNLSPSKFETPKVDIPTRVIVGVPPCEIHALNILDKFYTTDFVDNYYMERREKVIIIGKSSLPDEYLFSHKTNTSIVEEGYDLFFIDLGDYYLVWVGSEKGDDIVRLGSDIFSEDVPVDVAHDFVAYREKRRKAFTKHIDLEGVTDLMELMYDADFWDEFGEKCLSCGQCTMVCPTCTCFNVIDELELNKDEGHRRRYWDSCMFKDYSLVAGQHNFRESRAERLKLWYTHKLKAFIGHFGSPSCVGCGRCIITCPVEINVETVVEKLKG
ncbi:MAG: 4Fe-4S dicluster domain-containing protein [Armatimonadetes bacterium]|nr:4Fe-4S dicluster domain-containing protein [Armatimonadota bacterium]